MQSPWASLPRDLLAHVLSFTKTSPYVVAGVCRGWTWVLDEKQYRTSLVLDLAGKGTSKSNLAELLYGFATFVCKRVAATATLEVYLPESDGIDGAVAAALSAVVGHLHGTLRFLWMEPKSTSAVIAWSPLTSTCTGLRSLHAFLTETTTMTALKKLKDVDLVISGPRARKVLLPSGLQSCRILLARSACNTAIDSVLGCVYNMAHLHTLALDSGKHACLLCLEDLPEGMRKLMVRGKRMQIILGVAEEPRNRYFHKLEVLSLESCEFVNCTPADVLHECASLSGLSMVGLHHSSMGIADLVDLSMCPLRAVTLVSSPTLGRTDMILPYGIRKATLGVYDAHAIMHQHHVLRSVEELDLVLDSVSVMQLQAVWPYVVPMPQLSVVNAYGVLCPKLAVLLGQRFPTVPIMLCNANQYFDIEHDLQMLVDAHEPDFHTEELD